MEIYFGSSTRAFPIIMSAKHFSVFSWHPVFWSLIYLWKKTPHILQEKSLPPPSKLGLNPVNSVCVYDTERLS